MGEDDEVEVPLDVVHDLGLEVGLPVVGGDVEGHLGLDDALTDVLDAGSTRGRGGQVDQLINLGLGHLGLGVGSEELLDHLELAHLHRVPVLLHLDVDAGQTELLLLEGVEDVVRNDSPHPVQLPGQLQLLDERAADDGGGGSADASLAVEDDGAGGGGVLQHRNDLVKVFLGGGLLMPAWQLKMTGQEAVVSFSIATIWSKFSSAGACSWFMGILMGSSLGTLSLMAA